MVKIVCSQIRQHNRPNCCVHEELPSSPLPQISVAIFQLKVFSKAVWVGRELIFKHISKKGMMHSDNKLVASCIKRLFGFGGEMIYL